MKKLLTFLLLSCLAYTAQAQNLTQTVKGTILDKVTEQPLVGATVLLAESNPPIGATADENGNFTIKQVPVGRHKFVVQFIGYQSATIPEVLVTTGKEVVLNVALEESLEDLKEIVLSAEKGVPNNDMSEISTRSFSVEEATRYSGGRNDVGRLVSNFAGVGTSNDSRNDIVVRGNSPTAVLWRMEGIPIPNPSHYATLGTTGGPVSALNPNLLRNSDFMTGAFSAEYGNATGAVFDLALRNGNKDKFETTIQLNMFSGLEAMIEAPISKKNGSSFVASYRYSFAAIGQSLGLNVGTSAVPQYQDFTFNANLGNTKAGKFSIFGIFGGSNIDFIGSKIDTTDLFANKNEDAYTGSRLAIVGLKHTINIGKNSYLRTVLSYSREKGFYQAYKYPNDNNNIAERRFFVDINNLNIGLRGNTTFTAKLNARANIRVGFLIENINLNTKVYDRTYTPDWVTARDFDNTTNLLQPYAQLQYRFNENLTFNGGLHGQFFTFNNTSALEPRASLSYNKNAHTITLGYGLHSQLQPMPVYLYQKALPDGSIDRTNRDLDFTKAHHIVLGYQWKFADDWRVKFETYHQSIFNAPVDNFASGYSVLNEGADFIFTERAGLVNNGKGSNTGVEMTLEKLFSKGYYVLATVSVFDSKYKGSDGIERNSTFNTRNIFNVLGGKEWKIGKSKQNALTFDTRLTYSGGKYFTPVNLEASKQAGRQVLDETNFMGSRNPDYFRFDMKFGFRINGQKRKISHTFFFDMQNVTNRQNVFQTRYNEVRQAVGQTYQIGFFPDILYRVQF
jgi:hypothetical protein